MARNTSSRPDLNDSPQNPDQEEIEEVLVSVEKAIATIQERVAQIKRDRQRQAELKNRIDEVIPQLQQLKSQQLKEELKQLTQELDTIELNLESSLFTWGSLKEPFWQAVRFGGLGIVIGWLLKSCSG